VYKNSDNYNRVVAIIEYCGTDFKGWQRQPNGRTVQEELENCLQVVLKENNRVIVSAASRTDSGVHARGQIITFKCRSDTCLDKLCYSVGSILKGEVAITTATYVYDSFKPQQHIEYKEYIYSVLNRYSPPTLNKGYVWHIRSKLNLDKMNYDLQQLVGTHDFTTFKSADCCSKSTIKTIYEINLFKDSHDLITISFKGSGFLKQMIRIIVGTVVAQQLKGHSDNLTITEILQAKDRKKAGITAPAHGLILEKIKYNQDIFV
jgi:tRNA pseudouridine38-40 synthase